MEEPRTEDTGLISRRTLLRGDRGTDFRILTELKRELKEA